MPNDTSLMRFVRQNADAVLVISRENRIRYVNKAAEQIFGLQAKLWRGKRFAYNLTPQTVIPIKYGQTENVKWAELFFADAIWQNESVWVVTLRDVTERYHQEDKILKLTRAVEQSPVTVVITDLLGNIEYVNPRFTQITGYTFEEVLGKNPRVLKSGAQPPKVYQELWATLTDGREWRGEFENKRKDGTIYWEYASIVPIRTTSGRITHYLAVKENITEVKRQREELYLAHEELEQIFNSAADAMCVIGADATLLRVNDAFTRYFQIKRDAAIGKKDYDVFHNALCCIDSYRGTHFDSERYRSERDVDIQRADGTWRSFIVSTTPFFDGKHKLAGTVKNFKDITERKKSEEALKKDFRLASRIQKESLPVSLSNERVQIDTLYVPFNHVSGDFFDYVYNPIQDKLSGCVLDVMGHGLATALQTMAIRVLFHQAWERNDSLGSKMAWLNEAIIPYLAEDTFAAAIAFEFDFKQQKLTYVCCGIHYFLTKQQGKRMQMHKVSGAFLGLLEAQVFEEQEIGLAAGDYYYFFTDGIYDLWQEVLPDAASHHNVMTRLHALAYSDERTDDATVVAIGIL